MLLALIMLAALPLQAAERGADDAIEAGLRWLAENQLTEGAEVGAWQTGRPQYRPAMASFAGLAFLANGYLPNEGEYGEVIDRAMTYVMNSMDPEGYLGQGDPSGMYIHAICTLFGLSYLGTANDPEKEKELAEWCRRSLETITEAQQVPRPAIAQGGWRYTPYTTEADLSVTSWQLLALHAARQCGYQIDSSAFDAGLAYMDRAYTEAKKNNDRQDEGEVEAEVAVEEAETAADERMQDGKKEEYIKGYVYRPGVSTQPEPSVTGVAIFIKSLLEEEQDEKMRQGLSFLQETPPSWGGEQYGGYYFFALFYISQGMFQLGGETWEDYASNMTRILIEHQNGDGSWPFPPDNRSQSRLTGSSYPTALSILVLSLEKQYLPMYQRQKSLF